MPLETQLVNFAVDTRLEEIPERTVSFAKQLFAKIIASMIKGSTVESGQKATTFVTEHGTADRQAMLLGCGLRTSVEEASFVNGYFAHAAELEDDQFPSGCSDITVVPVLVSMIERYQLTGRDVLEATIMGMEIMNRIGTYSLASKGIVELPFYGVLGACVSAGKALRLESEQLLGAIGIAMGRASGLITNFGTDGHYIESALACRDGLVAALMAKNGMAGNPDIHTWLTHLRGEGNWDPEAIVGDLGEAWRIHTVWIKKYPCCFITHRPIDILFKLLNEQGFTSDEVVELLIEDNTISSICDRPDPIHTDDARFSFQHALAAALLDQNVDNHHFDMDTLQQQKFLETRKKIKIVTHEEWPKEFLSGPCRVTVTLADGRQITGESETAGGAPDSPLSDQEVRDLFNKILAPVMSQADIDWIWDFIATMETQTDLMPFLEKLRTVH